MQMLCVAVQEFNLTRLTLRAALYQRAGAVVEPVSDLVLSRRFSKSTVA